MKTHIGNLIYVIGQLLLQSSELPILRAPLGKSWNTLGRSCLESNRYSHKLHQINRGLRLGTARGLLGYHERHDDKEGRPGEAYGGFPNRTCHRWNCRLVEACDGCLSESGEQNGTMNAQVAFGLKKFLQNREIYEAFILDSYPTMDDFISHQVDPSKCRSAVAISRAC